MVGSVAALLGPTLLAAALVGCTADEVPRSVPTTESANRIDCPSAEPHPDLPSTLMAAVVDDFTFRALDGAELPSCVSLDLMNEGRAVHNFSVEETTIAVDIPVGTSRTSPPLALHEGEYRFYCSYHRDRGMVGTFTIDEPGFQL